MTFFGRRGALETEDFNHTSLSLEAHHHIIAHNMANLVIVGTDEGCVFRGIGLAFEYNHWDALIVGAVDGGGDRNQLVGCYNEQLDTALY